jgi:hypothetical protein
MADPIGLCSFPGISVIKSADFTLGHGISPSACMISTIPHTKFIADVGTLKITFDRIQLEFPDAALDHASLRVSTDGFAWSLRILDRRWKWRFGHITGVYNRRDPAGNVIKDSEKTPQELAKLLLEAMGEKGADVAALPAKPRPEVAWDHANPASELAALCESLGCRVVLGINNKVKIHKVGVGKPLPANGQEQNLGYGIDAKLRPDKLLLVGAPIRYQTKLELEAVGLETDGKIKPIDELSYKPAGGWTATSPWYFSEVTATYKDADGKTRECKELALQSVYRWYRAKEQASGGFDPPGSGGEGLDQIDQLFPLSSELNDSDTDPDGTVRPRPAYVEGLYWPRGDTDGNVAAVAKYAGDFELDEALGLVKFAEFVVRFDDNKKFIPATLYLTCAYSMRLAPGGAYERYEVERSLPGKKHQTQARVLQRPEIVKQVTQRYKGDTGLGQREDNEKDVAAQAKHYLDEAQREYQTAPATDVQYAGIVRIEPDGAIQQVTWHVGGGSEATTRASRNAEHSLYSPSYEEKRRIERADAINAIVLGLTPGLLGKAT